MKICVLQPSYERSELLKGYAAFDPPRQLAPLVPEWSFTHVFLDKATVYRQLKELRKARFDVYVNLCEGHLDWDVPSVDVIHALDSLDLPYTGPSAALYEPRKESLKRVAEIAGVATPKHVTARSAADIERAAAQLSFPLFVKPNEGGDSFGIDRKSYCVDRDELFEKVTELFASFDAVLIEEFVGGREFSVLVAADPDSPHAPRAFRPVEFCFPAGESFKTYELKNAEFHPESNVAVRDAVLEARLMQAARRIFMAYEGVGYCRMDFRLDPRGMVNVLDANFTCSVFYPTGYHGTADYILQIDGCGPAKFLRHIVREGIARHSTRQQAYRFMPHGDVVRLEAARNLRAGEVIVFGEAAVRRLMDWNRDGMKDRDRRRALAESILNVADPIDLAPPGMIDDRPILRWSATPNIVLEGPALVAMRDIARGEELMAQAYEASRESDDAAAGSPETRHHP